MMSDTSSQLDSAIDYKPKMDIKFASSLVEKLYGVKCLNIVELNAYDDKNYKVIVELVNNKYINKICENGYVLKVVNSLESKDIDFVEGQINVMLYLAQNGIHCPVPVKNIEGKFYSVEEIQGSHHVVRLLEFQKGKIFHEVEMSNFLLYRTGEYIAKLDSILKNFSDPSFDKHESIWKMTSIPMIEKFLNCITSNERLSLIKEIIDAFKMEVLTKLDMFESGLIHGDFNEQNIVVEKNDQGNWDIKAVLDFGDMHKGYYLFELALTMTYTILLTRSIDTGGHIIAGYSKVRKIPEIENDLLKVCIAARIVQSLVLGAYAHAQDPSNKYVSTTQASGWEMLTKLWNEPKDVLKQRWLLISENYLP